MENSCVKTKAPTVSGWARMVGISSYMVPVMTGFLPQSHKNGLSQKVWCELDQTSLTVSTKPGEKVSTQSNISVP